MKSRQHYEMELFVTQLAATSEVASIGLDIKAIVGDDIEIEEWLANVDDLAAVKVLRVRKQNSNNAMLRAIADEPVDNQHIQNIPAVLDSNTTGIANQVGSGVRERLYSNQYIRAAIIDTLDADKKLYFKSTYSSFANPLSVTVVGAGITLTTTKHELV